MNDDDQTPDRRTGPDVEALIRKAGARPEPPQAMADEVHAAVLAEWRRTVAARQTAVAPVEGHRRDRSQEGRTGRTPWLAAAAVATLAIGAWLVAPQVLDSEASVATVARMAGAVEYRAAEATTWRPLSATTTLHPGDAVRTTAAGRVALKRRDGLELRIDAATTLVFADEAEARLDSGRVYVDAGRAGAGPFELDTVYGQVRHLGTQYSTGIGAGHLEVAVREGSVAVLGRGEPIVAHAGEMLEVPREGRATRQAIAPYGDTWHWTQSVTPPFAIDDRTLDEFLEWAARETGRQLVYGSPEVARLAESTALRGSVADLMPEQAIGAVLTTTPSLRHQFAGPQLRIDREER